MALETMLLARAGLAMLVAFIGAGIAVSIRKPSHHTLCAMISVAAGALLSVTLLHIIPESLESLFLAEALLGIFTGYGLFFLISRYVSHICPACAATHTEERFIGVNILMIAAVSLHSTMDGIGVVASQAGGDEAYGIAMMIAICIHKLPEGLALASVGRAAGYSRAKAAAVACTVESTTLVGALAAFFIVGGLSQFWTAFLLAHIGGGFVYLTVHAMLGEMVKHERKSILIWAFFGFAMILFASLLLICLGATD